MPPKAAKEAAKPAAAASSSGKQAAAPAKGPLKAKANGVDAGKKDVAKPDRPERSDGHDFKPIPGKPDKAAHEAELNYLTTQIEKLQKQSVRLYRVLA